MSTYEIRDDGITRVEFINQMSRDEDRRASISITTTSKAISEPKTSHNGVLLESGEHGGAKISSERTVVGCFPGANISKQVEVRSTSSFTGVRFRSNSDSIPVVVSSPNATVTFIGCEFEKTNIRANTSFVKIQDGAKVHFIGCSFYPSVSVAGDVIENVIGNATNVNVVACSNVTGQSLGNVTQSMVTT